MSKILSSFLEASSYVIGFSGPCNLKSESAVSKSPTEDRSFSETKGFQHAKPDQDREPWTESLLLLKPKEVVLLKIGFSAL